MGNTALKEAEHIVQKSSSWKRNKSRCKKAKEIVNSPEVKNATGALHEAADVVKNVAAGNVTKADAKKAAKILPEVKNATKAITNAGNNFMKKARIASDANSTNTNGTKTADGAYTKFTSMVFIVLAIFML